MRVVLVLLASTFAAFVMGCQTNSSSGSVEYEAEYERQVEVFNHQAETNERQAAEVDEQSERYDRLLERQESIQSRFEQVMSKWEEQSRRTDAVLEAQEKAAGIMPQDESHGGQ